MLTEEEIREVEKIADKKEAVKKLLDFYNDCQKDGLKALRIALNKKLLDISASVGDVKESDNDDKTFERIDRIVTSIKKLPKENGQEEENSEKSSRLDRLADKKRNA